MRRYKTLTDCCDEGISLKEIARLALETREPMALQVFEELGWNLGQVLIPYLEKFQVELLILGGQVSKSFKLFAHALHDKIQAVVSLKEMIPGEIPEHAALYGVASVVLHEEEDLKRCQLKRCVQNM